MLHPETHLDLVRERHSDLLRQARAGELAQRLGDSRREERRTFLARMRRRHAPYQASSRATAS